jgi:hypothetical protein
MQHRVLTEAEEVAGTLVLSEEAVPLEDHCVAGVAARRGWWWGLYIGASIVVTSAK